MRERVIMHIDMNAFYASVAQHLNPRLRGKAVAVAGDPERRSGIILAKSREAKAAGVKTAEAIWQAKRKCPELVIVPPDYDAYKRYSRLARMICCDYTDLVEPFGLDESWIDVTGSLDLFGGDAMLVAQEISERVKDELGLTVSVGVSWNKVFAKLGSDTDPGDGIVRITRDNFRDIAWPMDASEMIYVGPATARKLKAAGYLTIGDLAHAGDYFLDRRFGKIGRMLRSFARGEDPSPVRVMDPAKADVDYAIKGIGNGLTAPHDLECESDVKALVWLLAESVSQRMRESRFRCRTISVGARRAADLMGYSRQTTLRVPTCLTKDVANTAMDLLRAAQPLDEGHAIRAIHVRATNLVPMEQPVQPDLFGDAEATLRYEKLDMAVDELRRRFGNKCVHRAVELTDEVMGGLDIKRDNTVHPVGFLR
ncbi:DNA polymerase IV [Eggerthellaceae bacterium zg-887]|uniref:Y-family DNA polymerase n=1 Tax=Xiamenia xianingshaonis TaxID=2682776 RepID=UPI00140E0DA0|nr:DNA polymerase IV [Xiamenia xianingshaonis]NHM15283.1 DNA polymerase IV [Xiamenia xianingshaonis]